MKRVLIALFTVVAAVIVLVFVLDSTTNSPAPDESISQGDTEQTTAPREVTITYVDAGFAERSYEVASGGLVTVENKSSHVLEFSSDNHPTHTENPELNMDALNPGETGTFTPEQSGEWGFHNHVMHTHTGQLTVR